ncbi:MAG: succinate dehydrogenase cytochrome b subunit [Desulfobacterales bacterium]|nr:succinate dehydrogenase cytochrome b subunit [Desulfobacterales bacterium]
MLRLLRGIISTPLGKKGLMALSGAGLGFFLLIHLLGNLTAFMGRQAFLSYAEHLHRLGPLIQLFEAMLVSLFAVHVILAALLYLENLRARPQRYAVYKRQAGHWGARTMPYTGLVILVFVLVHLANFHFTNGEVEIADLVRSTLHQPGYGLFYILSMAALGLHLSHGFWSMFQSLGLSHPKYEPLVRNGALAISLLIGAVFILIPTLAMLSQRFLLE